MAAILDAILDCVKRSRRIHEDFWYVILDTFLDLSWKNQLVTRNVHLKTNALGLEGMMLFHTVMPQNEFNMSILNDLKHLIFQYHFQRIYAFVTVILGNI